MYVHLRFLFLQVQNTTLFGLGFGGLLVEEGHRLPEDIMAAIAIKAQWQNKKDLREGEHISR